MAHRTPFPSRQIIEFAPSGVNPTQKRTYMSSEKRSAKRLWGFEKKLWGQVDMIAHEAVGVDTMEEPFDPFLQKEIEPSPVSTIEEDGLPGVAAGDDVIHRSGTVNLNVANNPSIRTWVSRSERLRGEPLTR